MTQASGPKYALGLRGRIVLIQLCLAAGMAVYIYGLWLPGVVKQAVDQYSESVQQHLATAAEGLVPLLLEAQVANVYDNLDALLLENRAWRQVLLFDDENQLIYPLADPGPPVDTGRQLSIFHHDIEVFGEPLGRLQLRVDLEYWLSGIQAGHRRLAIALLLVLGVLIVLSGFAVDIMVRKPIGVLAHAADRMARGTFDVALPNARVPEVRMLADSFGKMRESVQRFQEDVESIHLRTFVEHNPSAVAMLDTRMCYLLVSARWVKVFKLGEVALHGKCHYDLFPQLPACWREAHAKVMNGEVLTIDEIEFTHRDGTVDILQCTMQPWYRDDGTAGGILIFNRIITAQKEAELERERLEQELRQAQKLEALGTLAGGIAHELNTPAQYVADNVRFAAEASVDLNRVLKTYEDFVTAVRTKGDIDSALSHVQDVVDEADCDFLKEEVPSALDQAQEGVSRISGIVTAIKVFCHPGGKDKSMQNVNEALRSAAIICKNQWRYVATVEEAFDEHLPQLSCFPDELNQVFLNLIVNAAHAIEAREDGGLGTITLSSRLSGDQIEIGVADTGTGIPDDIAEKVFDPFFTTKEPGKGTGQGLSICHSIVVQKHGGTLNFESTPGAGTRFVIRLPLTDAGSAAADNDYENQTQNVA